MNFTQYDGEENKIVEAILKSQRPPTVYELICNLTDTNEGARDWGQLVHQMVKKNKIVIQADNTLTFPFSTTFGDMACGIEGNCTPENLEEPLLPPMDWTKLLLDASPKIDLNPAVHSPSHYTRGGIETIDFIEAKGLGFHLGNVVKYVSRAGFKEDATVQDLEKAMWYLNREIERLKKNG